MLKRKIKYYKLVWFKHDLPAGLSVFLIALPLCMGIALTSGAPLAAGLVSGIAGGLIVTLISGSQLAVSGPAAGLTTIVAASIASLGNYKLFLLAVMVAGLFQLLVGLFKLGGFANYFPSSVIKGMLAAIGIIVISKQVPIAIGYDQPDFWSSGFPNLFTKGKIWNNILSFNHQVSTAALITTLLSLLLLVITKTKKVKLLQLLPAPLLVVVLGIALNVVFSKTGSSFSFKPTQLVNIPANIFSNLVLPDVSMFFSNASIWKDGLMIGLLATLETLLCIEAIDKLDKQHRITPVNRELIAQGVGNITCGLLGAIPITAVVVRGAANIDAGGRTKMASFTHGLFLLLAVIAIPFVLNQIPYASLSAILIITGYNLTRPKLYANMWSLGSQQFMPFILTIVSILATDLLIGVTIGLVLSIYFIIHNNFKADYKISRVKKHETEVFVIKLNSNVTFLNKVNLRKSLDLIPNYSVLTIDGSESKFIDYDILEIISEYAAKAHNRHIELHLNGIEMVNVAAIH